MTPTDAFTTAARAEAARRNPPIDRYPDDFTYPRAALREHKRGEFEAAAEWARGYLAAHSDLTVDSETVTVESDEPTDAEVEAAAIALREIDTSTRGLDGTTYRDLARAALTAAKGARA